MVQAAPQKQGCLKVNILEAYTSSEFDSTVTPCFVLVETRAQRIRTSTTGDSARQRTWANEIIRIDIDRADQIDMRLCLVSQGDGSTQAVIGQATIILDAHVSQQKTERWYHLQQGSESEQKIGHIRIRTMWCPTSLDISPALPQDQEKTLPITFLDKTNAPITAALAEVKPYYKSQSIKYAEPLHYNPQMSDQEQMQKSMKQSNQFTEDQLGAIRGEVLVAETKANQIFTDRCGGEADSNGPLELNFLILNAKSKGAFPCLNRNAAMSDIIQTFDSCSSQIKVNREEWKLIHKQILEKNCIAGIISQATMPKTEESQQKKGIINGVVSFSYFGTMGRGDPLTQMFEYHGQPYKKNVVDFAEWETTKANGDGGEFGGGLPQAMFTENGVEHRCAQFGSILRQFGIRYGYYDPCNFVETRYIDPIVETFADQLGVLVKFAFAGPDVDKEPIIQSYVEFVKKFHALVHLNLLHHNCKFAAGDQVTIADFVMASYIGNHLTNPACPLSEASMAVVPESPKFEAYIQTIQNQFPHLKTRPAPGPF